MSERNEIKKQENIFIRKLKDYIKLIRVKHWIKNLLIFFALVFNGQLFNMVALGKVCVVFVIFSLVASSIYVINDIKDREKDRKHEKKCNRPIASGRVSVKSAITLTIILLVMALILIILCNLNVYAAGLIVIYFLLNLAYSLGLKNIPLVDLSILVTGFVIRVMVGGIAVGIAISNWLFLTVLSLSFYLGLGKRRGEIIKNGTKARAVLQYYSKDYLDKNMIMFLSMTIIFYSLWVIGGNVYVSDNLLIWTIPLIIVILMKYNMDIDSTADGDPIEVVFSDKILIGLMLIFVCLTLGIIYLKGV